MKLDQIESFRWVARLGSFTKAAVRLNTSQSTISMRVGELEQSLGVQLLDRSRRRVRLTPKGRDLLAYAESIHTLVAEAKLTVADPRAPDDGVRIGVAELIALTWLPSMVSAFHSIYPNVQIDLEIGLTGPVIDRVAAFEVDLGLVGLPDAPPADLTATPIATAEFAFLASPSMKFPPGPLHPKALENSPIISLGPGSHVANSQDEWLRANKVVPRRFNSSSSMEISVGLARSGLGIALLPVAYYTDDLEQGTLVRLDLRPPPPPVRFFSVHVSSGASPLTSKLIELARHSAMEAGWGELQK